MNDAVAPEVRDLAEPLAGTPSDLDALLDMIGESRLVLLGEASHGTHEFYRQRGEISRRLIEEKGFAGVAVEADWPDAYRANRWVRGEDEAGDAEEALAGFKRFPQWMWRNADVLDFLGWMREHNQGRARDEERAGFFGIDLYSLHQSIERVLKYLDHVDPEAAARARARYACFESFGEDTQAYGYATSLGLAASCEREVVGQLVEMTRRAHEYATRDGRVAVDDFFQAQQNARLVKNAERYYRSMFLGHVESWNLRDRHMAETVEELLHHLGAVNRRPARLVIWAHNSHLGDARATEMGARGELNVGQLLRERFGREAFNVGFTTHAGTVTAASDWDAPAERKTVRPSLPGSWERVCHELGAGNVFLPLRGRASGRLRESRLERAIGVIYRPETERMSHYFQARLADQFDALFHYDQTRAVEPLERRSRVHDREPAETYPSGV
jgi:erythromycin esterase-like protein